MNDVGHQLSEAIASGNERSKRRISRISVLYRLGSPHAARMSLIRRKDTLVKYPGHQATSCDQAFGRFTHI